MKKFLVAVTLFAFCGSAFAVNQMNTGCGLGTMLFGDKNDSKLMQVLVTSTNGTFTNQSTGITLDVQAFGCAPTSNWTANEAVEVFVQENIDSLIRDVAAGNGETIVSLASLMEVQDVEAFGSKLQQNFASIFPSSEVEYAHVADAIIMVSNS